jgi:hypothetical protein
VGFFNLNFNFDLDILCDLLFERDGSGGEEEVDDCVIIDAEDVTSGEWVSEDI